jgi:hypothetical protein
MTRYKINKLFDIYEVESSLDISMEILETSRSSSKLIGALVPFLIESIKELTH